MTRINFSGWTQKNEFLFSGWIIGLKAVHGSDLPGRGQCSEAWYGLAATNPTSTVTEGRPYSPQRPPNQSNQLKQYTGLYARYETSKHFQPEVHEMIGKLIATCD